MIELSKTELIQKLENLQTLLDEIKSAERYLQNDCEKEFIKKVQPLKLDLGNLQGKPAVFDSLPSFIEYEEPNTELKENYKKQKKLFSKALAVTLALIVLFFIFNKALFNSLAVIGIFATIILGLIYSNAKKSYYAKKTEYEENIKQQNKCLKEFYDCMEIYDVQKKSGVDFAKEYAEKYKKVFLEYSKLLEEYNKIREQYIESIEKKKIELLQYNFVSNEHYNLLYNIIHLLNTNRADDYKEALNLAINEEREIWENARKKANEQMALKRQAEAEENRLREEQRREKEKEVQQRLREREESAKRHEAEIKAKAEARRQASAAHSRCWGCINYIKCTSEAKKNGLTCGAFIPKR